LAVGALAVNPITAQLMSIPTEPVRWRAHDASCYASRSAEER
jgi:hypothetical protein